MASFCRDFKLFFGSLYDGLRHRDNGDPIACAYGKSIGTNLANDLGYEPLNIVIKILTCNGRPVAKFSDTPGKCMGETPDCLKDNDAALQDRCLTARKPGPKKHPPRKKEFIRLDCILFLIYIVFNMF